MWLYQVRCAWHRGTLAPENVILSSPNSNDKKKKKKKWQSLSPLSSLPRTLALSHQNIGKWAPKSRENGGSKLRRPLLGSIWRRWRPPSRRSSTSHLLKSPQFGSFRVSLKKKDSIFGVRCCEINRVPVQSFSLALQLVLDSQVSKDVVLIVVRNWENFDFRWKMRSEIWKSLKFRGWFLLLLLNWYLIDKN